MKVITNKYLEIRTLDFGSFVYNITTAPVHGWISVLAPNKVGKEAILTQIFFNINPKSDTKISVLAPNKMGKDAILTQYHRLAHIVQYQPQI